MQGQTSLCCGSISTRTRFFILFLLQQTFRICLSIFSNILVSTACPWMSAWLLPRVVSLITAHGTQTSARFAVGTLDLNLHASVIKYNIPCHCHHDFMFARRAIVPLRARCLALPPSGSLRGPSLFNEAKEHYGRQAPPVL